jgi:hypothetical protein
MTNSELAADSLVIAAAMLPADPGRVGRTSRQLVTQCRHEAGINVAHDPESLADPLAHERDFHGCASGDIPERYWLDVTYRWPPWRRVRREHESFWQSTSVVRMSSFSHPISANRDGLTRDLS